MQKREEKYRSTFITYVGDVLTKTNGMSAFGAKHRVDPNLRDRPWKEIVPKMR